MMVVSCSSGSNSFAREAGWGSGGVSTVGAAAGGSARAGAARGDVKLPAACVEDGIEFTGGFPVAGAAGAGAGACGAGTAAICAGAEAGADGADAGAEGALLAANGVGGFAAGFGSLLAFKVPSGTRCEAA